MGQHFSQNPLPGGESADLAGSHRAGPCLMVQRVLMHCRHIQLAPAPEQLPQRPPVTSVPGCEEPLNGRPDLPLPARLRSRRRSDRASCYGGRGGRRPPPPCATHAARHSGHAQTPTDAPAPSAPGDHATSVPHPPLITTPSLPPSSPP